MDSAIFISLVYALSPYDLTFQSLFLDILGCIHKATVLRCLRLIDSCFACNTVIHLSGPKKSTISKQILFIS